MAVTEYKPSASNCKYTYSKLKDVIYLVSKDHTKKVYIDDSEAYIDGLTELPLRLNGFNISLKEESSLDERYEFQKTVTLSMHGYVSSSIFGGRYYVILESYDGTFWMVNVDFPSKLTYTFNLSKDTYQTDFTLSSLSNFPTLKLNANFEAVSPVCLGFNVYGVDSLKLLEKEYCALDTASGTVYTYGKDFVDVEFLGESCSFQESFDGDIVTTEISFDIAFDDYKSSWHYNLLEFLQNLYAAIVTPKGNDNTFFAGFTYGLQPSFTVQTASQNGQSDTITVRLIESSNYGSSAASSWDDEQSTDTRWVFVKNVNDIICYECIGQGLARYLVQQEVTQNGIPTGDYKVLDGYTSQFPSLNVIGTFSNDVTFSNPICGGELCMVETDLPNSITYRSATCYTYSYSASCDWNVSGLASYMTVTPSSGEANQSYTLSVCNTKTPTTNESSTFRISSGNNVKVVNVNLTVDSDILNPTSQTINCLAQNVTFRFNANCPITVTSIDSRLTYQITNAQLIVSVPRNNSTADTITWDITVKDCNDNTQTVQIFQDKTYEKWVKIDGYICDGSTSYEKLQRYTGTTSTSINTQTSEYKAGTKIADFDERCGGSSTRWVVSDYYYCIDGDKWSFEEEQVYDGSDWNPDGNTRLLEMVESASNFCLSAVTYEWRLTDRWQCANAQAQYRWQPSGYTCVGYDKWERSIKQVSYDSGTTWQNLTPLEYSATTLIEADSEDCGYVPPTPPTPTSGDYLTFVAQEDGTFKLSGNSINYSLDSGTTWIELASNTDSPTVQSGNTIMWKGELTPTLSIGIGRFSSSGNFTVQGNPMSLLYGDDFSGETSIGSYAFMNLFSGCTKLTSAENLVLPATTVGYESYTGMFAYCSSLTTAMSVLPATELWNYCYTNMFIGCSSLTTAPELPAETLREGCYFYMFRGCSSLNYIKCLATYIAYRSTNAWLDQVASSGTFVKASSMNDWPSGTSGIPSNWSVQNA